MYNVLLLGEVERNTLEKSESLLKYLTSLTGTPSSPVRESDANTMRSTRKPSTIGLVAFNAFKMKSESKKRFSDPPQKMKTTIEMDQQSKKKKCEY